ncbi:MAG: hypothetical protein PG981_000195 [Wolbachia endosymbiont of Ctenocephalides orientis wCori]|nr:MAG: hypothetical protein PG981_000195 [Wolbachia endosymbiont of Ctenocephalides orientis wCori]
MLASCIFAVCTLGPPASVRAAIGVVTTGVIGAAMMLMSVLAITTDRGYEMLGSAKNWLNGLCVSQPGSKEKGIS